MLTGLFWLASVGHVEKAKVYRTFTYTSEEQAYLAFYVMMMVWLNDFCNAVSQYVIANAAAKWYFTEHVGGAKLLPSCLLCRGYVSGFLYHFGSLALGSFLIAITRPLRLLLLVLLFAGEVTDKAMCGFVSSQCACLQPCFESTFMHISKNAFIEMAMSSKGFIRSGKDAAQLLSTEDKSQSVSSDYSTTEVTFQLPLSTDPKIRSSGRSRFNNSIIIIISLFSSKVSERRWTPTDSSQYKVSSTCLKMVVPRSFQSFLSSLSQLRLL